MYASISTPDHEQLFTIAESQDGYFTTALALAAGFARSTHSSDVTDWLTFETVKFRISPALSAEPREALGRNKSLFSIQPPYRSASGDFARMKILIAKRR